MDIAAFSRFLAEERGWALDPEYYRQILLWRDWWRGYVPAFHDVRQTGLDGMIHHRRMYGMRMCKKVCEDWASILLSEQTTVTAADEAAARWLCGGGTQSGGILGSLHFWPRANALTELAFRSGTGAFVVGLENLRSAGGSAFAGLDSKITLDCLPAECILPITVEHGRIREAAFVSEIIRNGERFVYLQIHRREEENGWRRYRISNEVYREKDGRFQRTALPDGIAEEFDTGSDIPWFSVFSPGAVKNIPGGDGLGMAVFSEALDQARQVDSAFDNYHMDLFLGGKKVFYSKDLLPRYTDAEGMEHLAAPDDLRQQLFICAEGADPDAAPDFHEYNPDLRTADNERAVQDALNYFSFKTGLGTRRYVFEGGHVETATAYMGDRQDMMQAAARHRLRIGAALEEIFRAMLHIGKDFFGESFDPDTPLSVCFDDGYITDREGLREADRQDALAGFIPKWLYNMRWRGMSEEEAKRAAREGGDEARVQAQSAG